MATFIATYTAAGTFAWVAPAGVTSVSVQAWGGGAGANGAGSASDGGGGGGEYAAEPALSVSAGTSYAVVVGAGGAGAGGSSAGGSGGNSTFASTSVVAHGAVGAAYNAGVGAGGTGSSNTAHSDGGAGGHNASSGGGGGGSGGPSSAGNPGGNASGSSPGAGATAVTGGGPGGSGGASGNGSAPPSGPGGGGGAAGNFFYTGGAGGAGQVVITWTMDSPATIAASTPGGAYQWTVPSGVTSVSAQCWGAGAGGGNGSIASAGGGGEYAAEPALAVTPGTAYTFSVGAGGAGGTSGTNGGTAGGSSAITGTAVTVTAHGGSAAVSTGLGGAGGTGSSNATHHNGGAGAADQAGSGGGGGGSAGPSSAGNPAFSSSGASAVTGGGAGGSGGLSGVGSPGSSPGGGGGGAASGTTTNTGRGGDGQLILAWQHLITGSDTLTATDAAGGVTATVSGSDTLTATDGSAAVETPVTGSDTLTAADVAGGVQILITGSDTLHATDAATPAAASLSAADTIHAADYVPPTLSYVPWVPGPVVHPISYPSSLAVAEAADTLTATDTASSVGVTAADTLHATDGGEQITAFDTWPSSIPLQMLVELLINGTWTDITSYVYQRSNIVITRGQPDEATQLTSSSMTMTLDNRAGNFSPKNPAGAWFGFIGRNTQIRLSAPDSGQAGYSYVYRFWGEVSAWPPQMDATGKDQAVQITASGIWRRFSQNTATIGSPLTRYYANLSGASAPAGYWPCEDPSGATQFSSGIAGGTPMAFSGTPSLGSDDSFGGTDAIPQVSGSTWAGSPGTYESPGEELFSVPGTYSWTCPGGVTAVKAECWGGGGGGGGGDDGSGAAAAAGGGGGGEYAAEAALAVTPGLSYTLTVAAGGTGGAVAGAGTAGPASSITGDAKTVTAHGGTAGKLSGHGTGGTGSTNTTHHNGGAGANPGSGGGYPAQQDYSSSGTWTAPDGVTEVEASCWAGGGSGGGSEHFYYGNGAAGGGGGGGFSAGAVSVTPGSGYSVHVGGGAAAASGAGSGGTGGGSSFAGDSGTISAGGGHGGQSSSVNGGVGAGGNVGIGTTHNGGQGSAGGVYDGGGGGGGAGSSGAGGDSSGNPGGGGGAGSGGAGGRGGLTTGAGGGGGGYGGGGGGAGTPSAGGASSSGAGGPGHVSLEWTTAVTTGPGGGGGASGGSGATGNNGGIPAGGSAVSNGGPGGAGGNAANGLSPLTGPGGGGGGGDAAGSYTGGNGRAGQVQITSGTSTAPTSNVLRFLMHLDAGGSVDGTVIAEMDTNGTAAKLQVVYHTGGNLELVGYNSSSSVVIDSGSKAVSADGAQLMVSAELDASGTSVTWALQGIAPGATALAFSYTGTLASAATGSVTQVQVDPAGTLASSAVGQISVQYASTPLLALAPVIAGYAGELAGDRFLRLCAEEGIPGAVYSPTAWDFSDGTAGNWVAANGTLSNSAAWPPGGNSLLLTAAGGSGQWYASCGVSPASQIGLAVIPGDLVSAYADVNTATSVTGVGMNIDWFDAAGTYLSTTAGGSLAVDGDASVSNVLAVAPANAAVAQATVRSSETVSAGTLLYITNVRLDRNPMGPQTDAELVALFTEVAVMDGGVVYEPRDSFGLSYRTLASMQDQSASLITDFSQGQLAQPFQPTTDDQNTRNYITVTRGTASGVTPGSSYIAALTSGPLSTAAPPDGVGQYAYSATVNCYADSQLAAIGEWMLAIGTVDEMRYPQVNFDLSRTDSVPIFTALTGVDAADLLEIDNAPVQMGYGPIRQLVLGFTETLNSYVWTMAFNCVPESPYETG